MRAKMTIRGGTRVETPDYLNALGRMAEHEARAILAENEPFSPASGYPRLGGNHKGEPFGRNPYHALAEGIAQFLARDVHS